MASKKKASNGNGENREGALPEGFESANADRGAPWWLVKEGAVIRGYLLGRYKMAKARRGSSGVYFQVKLTQPTEGIKGKGEDAETDTYEPGTIMNVGDKYEVTAALSPLVDMGGKWEIFAECIGKEDIGENTMWRFRVGKKMLKAPPTPTPTEEASDDDIPF